MRKELKYGTEESTAVPTDEYGESATTGYADEGSTHCPVEEYLQICRDPDRHYEMWYIRHSI
jgi:hypothetical protein